MLFQHNVQTSSRYICRHFLSKPLPFSTSLYIPTLTKSSCIQLLQSCKSLNQLKQIQSQMFFLGLQQDTDALNKVMVFCTDPSLGNLNYAEKVFHYIQNRCLFVCNLMIKAFAKRGSFRSAIQLFRRLREEGLCPNNYTYPFVFKAIGGLRQTREGAKVHGLVVKSGLQFDLYVCNSLIDMYAELGMVGNFKQMFDEMPERSKLCWNATIAGYVKCRRFEDALDMFQRMRCESDEKPDEFTVVSSLSACTALKRLELGEEIYDYARRELQFNSWIGNALLNMYAKCGCLSEARRVFDEIPLKDVICCTSLVSGYVNCGRLDEAREVFDGSPSKDVVLWTSMINGYVQYNRFDEAMALFEEMQIARVKGDKFTAVALLTGCAQLGALDQGKWIHGYINESGIKIDAVVGTALIEMYAKCGCIDKSLEIFNGLNLREKDAASWTSIICGLARNGKTSKALELFSKMIQVGIYPDDITFIAVLSACSHGGLVDEGCKLFNSMKKKYELEPKLEHYGCMIDILGRAGQLGEAEELIERVPSENNEIVVPLYGALLSACRLHGNVEMGERVAKRLADIESSGSSVHTLLANIYASADRWEDVTKVRKKMKNLGVKWPGCSSIEINGIAHEFLVGDPSHPEMREIYFMLHRLMKPLLGLEENGMASESLVLTSS